jgi:hypothetical protein
MAVWSENTKLVGAAQAPTVRRGRPRGWLISRVDEDDVLDDNERALLIFIKQNSERIHPSLNELLTRAGV